METKHGASSQRGGVKMMFLCFRKRRNGSFVLGLISSGYNWGFVIRLVGTRIISSVLGRLLKGMQINKQL